MRLRHAVTLGAAVAGLLAVPLSGATAVAGTPAQQPPPKHAQAIAVACAIQIVMPVHRKREVISKGKFPAPCCARPLASFKRYARHRPPVQVKLHKGAKFAIAFPAGCRVLTFNMPSGSSVATEVHGPRLAAHEIVLYHGRIFMIASVSGHTFTVDFRGQLFVNNGAAIHDGRAFVLARPALFFKPFPG